MNKDSQIKEEIEFTEEYKQYLYKRINENNNIITKLKSKVKIKRKIIKYGIYLIIILVFIIIIVILISLIK